MKRDLSGVTNSGVREKLQRVCSEMSAENRGKLRKDWVSSLGEVTAPLSWKLRLSQEDQSTWLHFCKMKYVCLNHLSDHLITWPCPWSNLYGSRGISSSWIFHVVTASENNHHVARVDPAPTLRQPLLSGFQHRDSRIRPFRMEVVILVSHCWQLP